MSYPVIEVRQPGTTVLWVIIHDKLGVGRDCDGLLLRDDLTSRQHIEFKLETKHVTVTDLNSTNGTLLNGIKLIGTKPFLMDDVIIIGHTEIRLISFDTNTLTQATKERHLTSNIMTIAAEDDTTNTLDISDFKKEEGTVTIVFSDIETSTELAAKLGDQRWLAILKQHDRIFKQLVNQFHGSIIKSQGDGFMLAFHSVRSALHCVIAIQKSISKEFSASSEESLKIRIGVHIGEAIHTLDGDLFGRHVITASRISNHAKGGQILASSLVKQISQGDADIQFGEVYEIPLKGLNTLAVHQILWDDD